MNYSPLNSPLYYGNMVRPFLKVVLYFFSSNNSSKSLYVCNFYILNWFFKHLHTCLLPYEDLHIVTAFWLDHFFKELLPFMTYQ